MTEFAELIKEVHPGIFVHSVSLADDESTDKKAGWVSSALQFTPLNRK